MSSLQKTVLGLVQKYAPPFGSPPGRIVDEIVGLLAESQEEIGQALATDPTAVYLERATEILAEEIVVAYGCGWRRFPKEGGGDWDNSWDDAMKRGVDQVNGWMKATDTWLRFNVKLKGYVEKVQFNEAWVIATQLYRGTCDCVQLCHNEGGDVRDGRVQLRIDSRAERCWKEHRLSAWNPAEITLWNFIARAVKGDKITSSAARRHDQLVYSPQKEFAPGAVVQGMFYRSLYLDGVRYGKVLGWKCERHGGKKGFNEDSFCHLCAEQGENTVFSEHHNKRVVKKWLFIPKGKGNGPYVEEKYWCCQGASCKNYYRANLRMCPLCGAARTRGAAQSTVWMKDAEDRTYEMAMDTAGWQDYQDRRNNPAIAAVADLPSNLQQMLHLRYQEDRDESDIAEQMNLPVEQVRKDLDDARMRLQNSLQQDER